MSINVMMGLCLEEIRCCSECGSMNVQEVMWADPNLKKVFEHFDCNSEGQCHHCEVVEIVNLDEFADSYETWEGGDINFCHTYDQGLVWTKTPSSDNEVRVFAKFRDNGEHGVDEWLYTNVSTNVEEIKKWYDWVEWDSDLGGIDVSDFQGCINAIVFSGGALGLCGEPTGQHDLMNPHELVMALTFNEQKCLDKNA